MKRGQHNRSTHDNDDDDDDESDARSPSTHVASWRAETGSNDVDERRRHSDAASNRLECRKMLTNMKSVETNFQACSQETVIFSTQIFRQQKTHRFIVTLIKTSHQNLICSGGSSHKNTTHRQTPDDVTPTKGNVEQK